MHDEPVPAPPGSIVITPKEFYDGVRDDIAAIREAVSPLPDLKTRVDAHDSRLSRLERLAWVAIGIGLASGGSNLIGLFS